MSIGWPDTTSEVLPAPRLSLAVDVVPAAGRRYILQALPADPHVLQLPLRRCEQGFGKHTTRPYCAATDPPRSKGNQLLTHHLLEQAGLGSAESYGRAVTLIQRFDATAKLNICQRAKPHRR